MKIIIVRDGSAPLLSEFGQKSVTPGDAVLLGANVLSGFEPVPGVGVLMVLISVSTSARPQ